MAAWESKSISRGLTALGNKEYVYAYSILYLMIFILVPQMNNPSGFVSGYSQQSCTSGALKRLCATGC
jgi:hypothetical protein